MSELVSMRTDGDVPSQFERRVIRCDRSIPQTRIVFAIIWASIAMTKKLLW